VLATIAAALLVLPLCVYGQDRDTPEDYALAAAGATAEASREIVGFKRDHIASMAIDGEGRGDYWASDFIFGPPFVRRAPPPAAAAKPPMPSSPRYLPPAGNGRATPQSCNEMRPSGPPTGEGARRT